MAERREKVVLDLDNSPYLRSLAGASAATHGFVKDLETADGRMANLVQTGLALAPALVPIGSLAVPAVAGLATQLGMAAAGAGVAVLAFHGVGDALKALNAYQLDPTTANFEKLQKAMHAVGPSGREFVHFLDDLSPKLKRLRDDAQAGLLPGVEEGIDALLQRLPEVRGIVSSISDTLGELATDTGKALASDDWDQFFTFLQTEAAPQLVALGHTLGNIFEGLANAWMALSPLGDSFSAGLLKWSEGFARASENLDQNRSFQGFIDYVQSNGPRAMDALEAIGGAFVSLIEAAAPVGSAVLPVITALANALSAVADSPFGPIIVGAAAAIGTLGRSLALLKAVGLRGDGKSMIGSALGLEELKTAPAAYRAVTVAQKELQAAQEAQAASAIRARDAQFALIPTADKRAAVRDYQVAVQGATSAEERLQKAQQERSAVFRESLSTLGRSAAGIAGLTVASTGLADSVGLTNTASMALMGTMIAPGWGTAIGGLVGGFMDMSAAFNESADAADRANQAIINGTRSGLLDARAELLQRLADPGFIEDTGALHNALLAVNDALDAGPGPANLMSSAVGKTADQLHHAAEEAQGLSVQLENLAGFFDRRSAVRAFEQSIDELRKGLNKNSDAWDKNTNAGRVNLDLLDTSGRAILQVADKIKDTAARKTFLQHAREDLEGLAKAFPSAAGQINGVINKLDHQLDDFAKPRKPSKPEVDDKPAKKKLTDLDRRMADWQNRHATAKVDADNKPAKDKINSTDELLAQLTGQPHVTKVNADTSQAMSALASLRATYDSFRDKTVHITVSTNATVAEAAANAGRSADGSTVPDDGGGYRDWIPYLLAPREEVVSNRHGQADAFRPELKDINAGMSRTEVFGRMLGRGLADGGTAGGLGKYSVDDQLAILSALQQIRDLQKQLADRNKKGQLTLTGLDRRIAEVQLEAAQHDLRAAKHREEREAAQKAREKARETRQAVRSALGGFSLDGIVPDNTPVTIAGQAADALQALKKQILDAGGEWTKAMRRWAKELVAQASHLDDINSLIDIETKRRDEMQQTLEAEQQSLEQLQSTMQAFSDQVGGNFRVSSLPGATTTTIEGTVDPALAATLAAKQARLAEIRGSDSGDSVTAAAEASRLTQEIAALQAEVTAQQQPVEQTTDAYQALRKELQSNTADAEAFAQALQTLAGEGLNSDLFAQIASSGDLATALALAAGGQAAVDDINALWAANAAAAAQVAAFATQQVYGAQEAALMAQIDAQNLLISGMTASIELLTAQATVLGDKVRAGATTGAKAGANEITHKLGDVQKAIEDLPRITAEHKKKSRVG